MPSGGRTTRFFIWEPITDRTILPILGDVISTPIGWVSIGDILLTIGALLLGVCILSVVKDRFVKGKLKGSHYRVRY